MRRFILALTLLCACRPGGDAHITAASALTRRYTESQFARWEIEIRAAGSDCSVLLVDAKGLTLDDALVDAIHDGAGPYAVDGRGMAQFARERRFRGVVYRDPTRRRWWRGRIDRDEPLTPCRREPR